ncbi:hypothetical protein FRX31_003740 [Thalictrum thalictroides]|uniref:Uncharacterized protein n=1 Tax=Thalictrum thalictroides TaxID=46969 RepID=A0A7J6XB22_THATH|nr:hypothetical protein FRX31_003740 [Thalictrum thalictroides]
MAVKDEFMKGVAFVIGKGSRISFWNDIWCGETTLRYDFPKIYLKSNGKTDTVAAHLNWKNGQHVWTQ